MRVALGQFLEVIERQAQAGLVAVDDLIGEQPAQEPQRVGVVHQAFEVPGIVNVGVRGVGADESIERGDRVFASVGTILHVRQIELRLFGVPTKRVERGQPSVKPNGLLIAARVQGLFGLLVHHLSAWVVVALFVTARAENKKRCQRDEDHPKDRGLG